MLFLSGPQWEKLYSEYEMSKDHQSSNELKTLVRQFSFNTPIVTQPEGHSALITFLRTLIRHCYLPMWPSDHDLVCIGSNLVYLYNTRGVECKVVVSVAIEECKWLHFKTTLQNENNVYTIKRAMFRR